MVTAAAVVVRTDGLKVSVPVVVWATATAVDVEASPTAAAAAVSGALLFWTCVPA